MSVQELPSLGQSIPPETAHAVSVSLPTWNSNIGYEEGEAWVVNRMTTGYPRFFIHKNIEDFARAIVQRHGSPGQKAFLFPSHNSAARCTEFLKSEKLCTANPPKIIDLFPNDGDKPTICAVLMAEHDTKSAKAFWQHTGEGISSRRAEYCSRAFETGTLAFRKSKVGLGRTSDKLDSLYKGPRRYQKGATVEAQSPTAVGLPSTSDQANGQDVGQFVEERFGRNLDLTLSETAKSAIRKRIAGAFGEADGAETSHRSHLAALMGAEDPNTRSSRDLDAGDVYLYPCGMNAIFHAHQLLMKCINIARSINYGFPYIDTLKILEKFGPGCLFYGHGSQDELEDLEKRCLGGERFLAFFCEFPGNPLLKTPDLTRIRGLADTYKFVVVVDETIGNFVNVNILPSADIVVSSLTKVFAGECNVMGGSMVLNPQSRFYSKLKPALEAEYEDNYWPEDAIYMERNSRDFRSRIDRINVNAEAVCEIIRSSPTVKEIFYPKFSSSRPFYDRFRNPEGGYGGLLSVTFNSRAQAIAFFDNVKTAKGPSLGTNFTLSSPYVLLAHYGELDWAREFGVDSDLVRMSIGLESPQDLIIAVQHGLQAAQKFS